MNSKGRARFTASPRKAQRVPSTVWYFILVLLCLAGAGLTARLLPVGATQTGPRSTDELWQEITTTASALAQTRKLGLERGRVLRLNRQALAQLLSQAPREFTSEAQQTKIALPLPLPDGTLARFRIEESPVLVPELAAQYPEIKSYRGQGIDDPALTMRCDLTPQGFHALILSGGEAVNIHPVEPGDLTTYLSYSGQDLKNELQRVRCDLDERQIVRRSEPPTAFSPQFQSGGTLRTFRLAIATTQEYTNHPQLGGGTVAGAIASLNTWVNNLNVIYETELSVHLNLVTDNRLIFTAEPDGFTNGTPGTMMREVQPKLRDALGVNNYDVGHVLGTDSGGVAGLGVVCENTGDFGPGKGGGASGMGGPVGNSGSLNLWAHEIGHQFGADHTMNGTLGSCNGNRSARSAWEPGSGSTIMSYAGNCNNDNTEGNQLRFHVGSLNQMLNYLGSATGASCGVRTNTGNNPPNVSGGPDFTIPRNTPFTLTAASSDPDLNDLARLTYVWEQMDAGGDFANDGSEASYTDANDPPATTRPLFRVFAPTTSPSRTFPSLTYILNNANDPPHQVGGRNTAEELPRVGRALNFRVTLRDQRGGVNDDHVTLTVDGNSGPFLVTAPNTATTWTVGSRQTVTWNVNNTNAAPINAASVRILLSTDGGLTFPVTLATDTPNDGTEDITAPNGLSTAAARIKVEAVGNIFFDISDANFTINAGAGCPLIAGAAPNAGNAGTNVTINGAGFTGVTAVRFGGNVAAANFTVVNDTQITATVPAGAVTGPITLSKANCPDVSLAAFTVCANAPATLQVDDGSAERSFSGASYFLNRLTPTNYPATLGRVAIQFAGFQGVPAGTPITILAGANTDGDANIDNTEFQTVNAQVGALEQFTSYDLAQPITISAGDFVVGYRIAAPAGSFPGLRDQTVVRNRSYTSNDGVRFDAHSDGNFLIRAEYLNGCGGGVTCPTVAGVNPTNGRPGSTVIITGTNFNDVTAVRFGANAPAVFTINSGTQITATVPANAATGPITISRVGCPDAQSANFTVVPLTCPTAAGINPTKAAPGSAITITGAGLTGVSVVKFANEASANFTVNSDTQITAIVPQSAASGPVTISRTGCPNVQTAAFFPCGVPQAPLQVDDGTSEGAFGSGAATLFLVNRLTPANHPARLDSVQILFAAFQNIPTGTNITVLAGANADGDANIDNTVFQTVPAQVGALGQFTSYNLTTPLTINAGDFVVGFSITPATNGFPLMRDTTSPKGRSYSSTNGTAFNLIDNQANLFIRGQYSLACEAANNPVPTLASLNPATVAAGAPGFNLTVNGANFIQTSVVRWNGQDRQTTFVSATQLRIAVTAADIAQAGTAGVTVFTPTPGGGVSNALNFAITGCPAITINPATLPGGNVNVAYNQALSATGGTAPYAFSLTAGAPVTARFNTPGPVAIPDNNPAGVDLPVTVSGVTSPITKVTVSLHITHTFDGDLALQLIGPDGTTVNLSNNRGGGGDNFGSGCQPEGQRTTFDDAAATAISAGAAPFAGSFRPEQALAAFNGKTGAAANGAWRLRAVDNAAADIGSIQCVSIFISQTAPAPGLSLAANGTLSGTPTTEGTFNFTVRATDANQCASDRTYALTVTAAAGCPTVTGINPATGAAGAAVTITGTNFTGVTGVKFANNVTAAFTVVDATTITTTVPAGAVTGPITISKTGCADVQTASFTIGCPAITINPATLPDGSVNVAYNQPLTATGGTAPYAFSLVAGKPVTTGFNGAGPIAIPDNNPTGADLPVTVSGVTSLITKVTVSLHITHTFDGDLTLQLIGPDGTTVNLSNKRGGNGANYGSACLTEGPRTIFDDAAATAIGAATAPFVGSFRPEQVLSAFNGKTGAAANGVWRLRVVDGAAADIGAIQCVSIFITQTLPAPGLSLAANGTLSGTPTTAGTFDFTVRATDANQCASDRTYALTITAAAACPTVTNINPATGAIGAAVTITGTNFTGVTGVKFANNVTAAFTVVNATTITTTVPAGAVTGPITISKTGCADVQTAAFTVGGGCPTITINPAALPNGNVGGAYNQALSATGGTAPYAFSLTAGNPATTGFNAAGPVAIPDNNPAGADLNVAVSGITSPITKVTVSLHITHTFVRDLKLQLIGPDGTTVDLAVNRGPNAATTGYGTACAPDGSRTAFDDAAATLIANGAPPFVGTFKPDQVLSAFNGKTGAAVNGTWKLRVIDNANVDTGSIQCVSIFISQTAPAPGLALAANGTLSGTPTDAGAFNFTVRATDANQCVSERTYTLTIGAAAAACPTVTNISSTTGAAGAAVTITGTNFAGVTGVKFANNVTATFTVVNATTITTTVPAGAVTGPITVSKAGCADAQTAAFTIGCPTITINPATLPNGNVGGAYNQALSAAGGTAPYTFSLTAGNPATTRFNAAGPVAIPDNNPAGAELPVTVSGITAPITKVTVSLHITHTFDQDLRLQLVGPDGTTVNLSNNRGAGGDNFGAACLPEGQRTTFDDAAATAIGAGAAPFVGSFRPEQVLSVFNGKTGAAANGVWRLRVVDGAADDIGSIQCVSIFITQTLPAPGVSLAADGTLSGTPTTAGAFNFTVRAADANQCAVTRTYTLTVGAGNLSQRIAEQK